MNKDGFPEDCQSAPGEWLVVEVSAPEPGAPTGPAITRCLLDIGGTSVETTPDGRWKTWIRLVGEPKEMKSRIRSRLARHLGDRAVTLRIEPDRDWLMEWRQGLAPRRVGSRLVISPSWATPRLRTADILIRIDPEMAFGTGEHGSTRTALRLLEGTITAGERVLDLGTGSGILAIAAARLGGSVVAVEADPEAAENARRNVRRNGVEERVRIASLRVDEAVLRLLGTTPYDLVLANVDLGFTAPLLPGLEALTRPDGRLVAAGLLAEESDVFTAAARAAGLTLLRREMDDGWWGGLFTPAKTAA